VDAVTWLKNYPRHQLPKPRDKLRKELNDHLRASGQLALRKHRFTRRLSEAGLHLRPTRNRQSKQEMLVYPALDDHLHEFFTHLGEVRDASRDALRATFEARYGYSAPPRIFSHYAKFYGYILTNRVPNEGGTPTRCLNGPWTWVASHHYLELLRALRDTREFLKTDGRADALAYLRSVPIDIKRQMHECMRGADGHPDFTFLRCFTGLKQADMEWLHLMLPRLIAEDERAATINVR